jgi:hypothetical protein
MHLHSKVDACFQIRLANALLHHSNTQAIETLVEVYARRVAQRHAQLSEQCAHVYRERAPPPIAAIVDSESTAADAANDEHHTAEPTNAPSNADTSSASHADSTTSSSSTSDSNDDKLIVVEAS